jgi:biotin transport system permease protein/energy-coupling factor transport system permease protein
MLAMKERTMLFRYKRGSSICHRLPALIKFVLMLCAAITVMFLPLLGVCAGIIFMVILASFCGFTVREQCADIKPACYYAFFLFIVNITANLYTGGAINSGAINNGTANRDWLHIITPRADYVLYAVRLCLVMQLSALLFRTTTSIEIKETLCAIETGVRTAIRALPAAPKIAPDAKLGKQAALMISFIPALFELWEKLNRAYRARGSRGGFAKYRILLTALFALSFHYAAEKAKALAAREN